MDMNTTTSTTIVVRTLSTIPTTPILSTLSTLTTEGNITEAARTVEVYTLDKQAVIGIVAGIGAG